ncbi:MAG TPA: TOBE domain-containing protein, partial [Thermoanaerobaculia bacterium]|nr:TOBE domain-containing protein [Thermoanaerobaculia bacterium]
GSPLEVYDRPATRFVAGFIGTPPMNFFEGELAGDGLSVTLGGGLKLPLPRPELASSGGRKVVFGVRPEHILVSASGSPLSNLAPPGASKPARVPAVIEVVEPLGHRVVVTASTAAGPLQLETEIHVGIRPQEKADLWFDMNRVYLFDRETECVI